MHLFYDVYSFSEKKYDLVEKLAFKWKNTWKDKNIYKHILKVKNLVNWSWEVVKLLKWRCFGKGRGFKNQDNVSV